MSDSSKLQEDRAASETVTAVPPISTSKTFLEQHVVSRIQEMPDQIKKLNQAYANFNALLIEYKAAKPFHRELKALQTKGAKETGAKKMKSAFYHDAPHPAELAHYVEKIMLSDQQPLTTSLIAAAAAAYHDVIQGQSTHDYPIKNETASAIIFATEFNKVLFNLKNNLIKNKSPEETQHITQIIDQFALTTSFLADQLIALPTYLVRPQNTTLLKVILDNMPDPTVFESSAFAYAQKIISVTDTSLGIFPEVLKDQTMMKALGKLPKEMQATHETMDAVKQALDLQTPDRLESFLLFLTQDVRMLMELNKLAPEETTAMLNAINNYRSEKSTKVLLPPSIFEKFTQSLDGAITFANSLGNSSEILAGSRQINSAGWKTHAADLANLKKFCSQLQDPHAQSCFMSSLVFLASHQKGVELVLRTQKAANHYGLFHHDKKAGETTPAPDLQHQPKLTN